MRTFEDIIPPSRRTGPPGAPLPPPPGTLRPVGAARRGFPYIIAIVALLVLAGSVATLIYFSRATVEITPNTSSLPVEGTFTAGASDGLPFALISAKKVATVTVTASGTKQATSPASGSITIYNTQSKPQTLVTNTRFATAAGLTYRIHATVTIPAGSTDKPGSVTATAYADKPGPTYNIDPSSFTVPGLVGTPEASAVYARSTVAMAGGASGSVPVVDAATEHATIDSLSSELAPDLQSALGGQVPPGYVLLPGAATSSYRELTPVPSASVGKADIQVEGTITAVVFPSAALAGAIASSTTGGGSATLAPDSTLMLTPISKFPSSNAENFPFSLSGAASLISKVDPMQIATAIAGKSRGDSQVVLANYPEIKHAILVLRPFWRQSFPEDPASIKVVVTP